MRSLVMAVNLFMSAISSALSQAFTGLSADPLLVWNYATVSILAFVFGFAFYATHRSIDKEEDQMNMIGESTFVGKTNKHASSTDA